MCSLISWPLGYLRVNHLDPWFSRYTTSEEWNGAVQISYQFCALACRLPLEIDCSMTAEVWWWGTFFFFFWQDKKKEKPLYSKTNTRSSLAHDIIIWSLLDCTFVPGGFTVDCFVLHSHVTVVHGYQPQLICSGWPITTSAANVLRPTGCTCRMLKKDGNLLIASSRSDSDSAIGGAGS